MPNKYITYGAQVANKILPKNTIRVEGKIHIYLRSELQIYCTLYMHAYMVFFFERLRLGKFYVMDFEYFKPFSFLNSNVFAKQVLFVNPLILIFSNCLFLKIVWEIKVTQTTDIKPPTSKKYLTEKGLCNKEWVNKKRR